MESVKPYLSSHKVPLFYILHAPLTSGLFSLISELPGLETVFQRFSKDSDSSDAAEARVSPDYARDWKQSEVCEVCKCRRTSAGPATEEVTEKPQKSSFNISDLTKSKNSFTASSPPSKLDFDPFNPFLKGFGAPSAANAFPANAWTPTMFGMIPNPMIQSLHSYFGLEYHPPAFPLPFPPQWPSQSTLNGMLAAAISDKKKQQQEKAMKNSEAAKAKEVLKMETNGNAMEDQPLDLSAKTGIKIVVEDMSSDSPSESPPIASKSEPKQENVLVPPKMPLMVGTKRNYSQMDLEKAVLDIRSGRLGTRRASVVYGIPRSTLRNKIYKLEAAAELSGEPSQYKRRRAGGQTLQERLTAGESIREARKAQKAISTPENTWPTGVPPQPVETLQNGTASPEKSTFVEDLKPKAAAVAAAAVAAAAAAAKEAKASNSDADSVGDGKCGDSKKTRPKRGHYRQYGKSKLEEAVQTVRRGEMSVHKAGSLFGVPHSTLEYKVKERNLMRNKKNRSEKENGPDSKGSSPPAAVVPIQAELIPINPEPSVSLVAVSAP